MIPLEFGVEYLVYEDHEYYIATFTTYGWEVGGNLVNIHPSHWMRKPVIYCEVCNLRKTCRSYGDPRAHCKKSGSWVIENEQEY